jgi:serine/threonine protein kinase
VDSDRATVELVEDAGREASRRREEPPLEGGAHIGRYVILHRHGTGGMGHVYAAYDPELDRKVALKLVRPRYASKKNRKGTSQAHARMMREAQALARLSHPNVVAIHDVGLYEGQLFLAMDFVEGQTLDRWVTARKRTWQEVVGVYLQAGHGLAGAHAAGLVHRDFKPQNAIVGGDGRVRVLDFGLAHRQNTDESSRSLDSSPVMRRAIAAPLTVDGAVVGTPAYMAPEQHLRKSTDARTDQFAFCM